MKKYTFLVGLLLAMPIHPKRGLMPLIGLRYQVDAMYFEDDNEATLLTNDWQCSVVTLEEFVTAR